MIKASRHCCELQPDDISHYQLILDSPSIMICFSSLSLKKISRFFSFEERVAFVENALKTNKDYGSAIDQVYMVSQ